MRTAMTVWRAAAALAAAFVLPAAIARAHETDLLSFRILFPADRATPYHDGEYGAANDKAIRHMARMLKVWEPHWNVRFTFVADRSGDCAAAGCDPIRSLRLLHDRVAAAEALLVTTGLVWRNRIDGTFLDRLPILPAIPAVPSGSAAIDLRIQLDMDILPASVSCPWRILLYDPDLPPAIGPTPTVPLVSGQEVAVGGRAVVYVKQALQPASKPVGLWEVRGGEVCRDRRSLLGNDATALPPVRPVRLHLIGRETGEKTMRHLMDRAGDCVETQRGFGNEPLILSEGDLQPPLKQANAEHCFVTFLPVFLPAAIRPSHASGAE
ncbi:MAG: hypothetical protein ACREC6_11570 [Hyphomicrobiaceae bacterium]